MAHELTQFRRWLVLPQYRHAIYVTPKVANRSIILFFNRLYGSSSTVTNPSKSMHRWLTLDELNGIGAYWQGSRVVTVRNPIDRVLAVYNYHVLGEGLTRDGSLRKLGLHPGMTLEELCDLVADDIHANPHWSPVCAVTENPSMVVRFEDLARDWARYRKDYLGSTLTLDHVGRTPRRVDPGARQFVHDRLSPFFREEMAVFGYS